MVTHRGMAARVYRLPIPKPTPVLSDHRPRWLLREYIKIKLPLQPRKRQRCQNLAGQEKNERET